MTFNSNEEQYKGSALNPFVPTKRDIERTEVLADKNIIIAGLFGFFIPIGAMIYLNRVSNNLKIIAYFAPISFAIVFTFLYTSINQNKSYEEARKSAENYDAILHVVQVLGSIAFMTENARAVTLARKRQSEANF
ncbi:MAG: hypothetical protein WBA39_13475 [Rivularia sp. (in: cyanobacteria)]